MKTRGFETFFDSFPDQSFIWHMREEVTRIIMEEVAALNGRRPDVPPPLKCVDGLLATMLLEVSQGVIGKEEQDFFVRMRELVRESASGQGRN